MSKERYEFLIPHLHHEEFLAAVRRMIGEDPKCHSIIGNHVIEKKIYTYKLDLTKYELLYIRLAAKGGRYIQLTTPQQDASAMVETVKQMA